jgi:hypothetical protein
MATPSIRHECANAVEDLAVRLAGVAPGSVIGAEIYRSRADPGEDDS